MPNKLSQFWQELKRRNVVRVITVYAGAAFVIIELINNITEPLRLPEWTPTLVIVLLAIGFPVIIIFSWIYDIHPEGGMVKTEPAHKVKAEDIKKVSSGWKIASYISFVVILGLIVLNVIPHSEKKEILDKSIAILPFINDSPEQERMYFINGTMEAILDNLSKIEDLRVVSRTSVEQYRNNPKPIPVVAEEMNVSYVLEGSGHRDGDNVRIFVQLLNGKKDQHLWSNTYQGNLEDIFSMLSEIAQQVAGEIEAIITPEERTLIEKIPTTNLTALDFYQRGREEYWNGNIDRAEELYHKALEYDSTFALAYIGLAMVYQNKNYVDTYFNENFMDSVLILADKALSFDPRLSDAYIQRGEYYRSINDREQAKKEYDKAIKLNPNNWMAYISKGNLYSDEDNYKETIDNYYKTTSLYRGPRLPAIYRELAFMFSWNGFKEIGEKYLKETLALDYDSARYYRILSYSESDNGNYNKGNELLERLIAIDSSSFSDYLIIGNNYTFLGQFEEALVYYKESLERFQDQDDLEQFSAGIMQRLGQTYLNLGMEEEATYYLNRARDFYSEMDELERAPALSEMGDIFVRAALYATMGDKEKTFEYLRLFNRKQHFPVWIVKQLIADPAFNSIRDEPEFQQIFSDVEAKYQADHERVRQWLEENDMM